MKNEGNKQITVFLKMSRALAVCFKVYLKGQGNCEAPEERNAICRRRYRRLSVDDTVLKTEHIQIIVYILISLFLGHSQLVLATRYQ